MSTITFRKKVSPMAALLVLTAWLVLVAAAPIDGPVLGAVCWLAVLCGMALAK